MSTDQTTIDSSSQRPAVENSTRLESSEPAVIPTVTLEPTPVSPELALRRQRRRVNMARYRKKMRDRAVALGKDVEALQEEIKKLTMQYTSIAAQVTTQTTPWNVAAEYFRLFRHGSPSTSATRTNAAVAQVQRDFLQATIASNMQSGPGCGVEAHLQVWRFCALCHQDFDFRLSRLEPGDGGSLVATTTCTAVITTDTLQFAFPHLVQQDQAGNWSPIVAHLLGQTFVIPGTTRFNGMKRRSVW